MAKRRRLFGPTAASTTAATVFTNTTSQDTKLESMIIAQPTAGLAKVVRLSLGTDAAGTRVIQYPIPAGDGTYILYPNLVVTGTEILQLSVSADTGVAIVTGSGSSELV